MNTESKACYGLGQEAVEDQARFQASSVLSINEVTGECR